MTGKHFIYFTLCAFIGGTLLLVFMQYNSAKNIGELIKGNEKLLAEFKVGNSLNQLEKNVISVESNIRGAIASGDSSHLEKLNAQVNEVEADIKKLHKIRDNDSIIKYIDELDYIVHRKLLFSNELLDTYHRLGKAATEELVATRRGKLITDTITDVIQKIDSSRQLVLVRLTASIDKSGRDARTWGNILIIVVLASGGAIFWFTINRILQQNQLIHQLDISEKKVKETARIKENFMANMSHEIRTPMNAVLGFTNLLTKQQLDEESKIYVRSIQQAGENLLTIINDILDLSKIEAGMIRIDSAPFIVRELFDSIKNLFDGKATEKGLYLSMHVEDSVPVKVEGDAVRLTQILVNLLGNALKFTKQGGIVVKVMNKGRQDNLVRLQFSVTDTGIGIEEEKSAIVFERFQQAEDSITRKYGGTGLGLSIVKDLVSLQNGTIAVESELNKGTTFRFMIPYKIFTEQSIVEKDEYRNTWKLADVAGKKILVVEDNEMNQTLMKHLLKSWHLSFDTAANGREAIEKLLQNNYHLILMDVQMPEMDGYTASRYIRDKLKFSIPIIAMTAHAFAGEREKCLLNGMDEYISKPVKEIELKKMISRFLATKDNSKAVTIKHATSTAYQYINLEYMKKVSGGSLEYEKTVTGQFIEIIPSDIRNLEDAISNKDIPAIKHIAHNMKTSISVMGLTQKLQALLDSLEYGDRDLEEYAVLVASLKSICLHALTEARDFYKTFPV